MVWSIAAARRDAATRVPMCECATGGAGARAGEMLTLQAPGRNGHAKAKPGNWQGSILMRHFVAWPRMCAHAQIADARTRAARVLRTDIDTHKILGEMYASGVDVGSLRMQA